MRTIMGITVATALAAALTACGSPSEMADEQESSGGDGDTTVLKVGATPVPHAEILGFVQENLAADAGLDIEVVEFTDYNQPNAALAEGELDANYFQHKPFLEEYLAGNENADLTYIDDVHLESLGLYSTSVEDVAELQDGAEIAMPNDGSNMGRALKLLEDQELLTLKEDAGETASEQDIKDNPKNLEITPVKAAQLPRSVADVDAAVVNGNYALEAGLTEDANSLAWENTDGNPYANGLVVNSSDTGEESIAKLNELLHSAEVTDFIQEEWKGVVIPTDAAS